MVVVWMDVHHKGVCDTHIHTHPIHAHQVNCAVHLPPKAMIVLFYYSWHKHSRRICRGTKGNNISCRATKTESPSQTKHKKKARRAGSSARDERLWELPTGATQILRDSISRSTRPGSAAGFCVSLVVVECVLRVALTATPHNILARFFWSVCR